MFPLDKKNDKYDLSWFTENKEPDTRLATQLILVEQTEKEQVFKLYGYGGHQATINRFLKPQGTKEYLWSETWPGDIVEGKWKEGTIVEEEWLDSLEFAERIYRSLINVLVHKELKIAEATYFLKNGYLPLDPKKLNTPSLLKIKEEPNV